jgi:hypothetical protein
VIVEARMAVDARHLPLVCRDGIRTPARGGTASTSEAGHAVARRVAA